MRDFGRKVNAGDAGGGKHARETFFGGSGFEGRAVEQELVAGNGEEHAGFIFGAGAESGAEFGPGGLVLFFCARMAEVIHSRELEQDVEAANEGASRSGSNVRVRHVYVGLAKPRLCIQVWGEVAAGTMVRVSCLVLTNILQRWWERGTGTNSDGTWRLRSQASSWLISLRIASAPSSRNRVLRWRRSSPVLGRIAKKRDLGGLRGERVVNIVADVECFAGLRGH